MAPLAVTLALVMWRVSSAYSPVAADAARLVSVFNGPVVAHLMECLEGREYLRTFGQSGKAMDHALAVLEVNARAQILNAVTLALVMWRVSSAYSPVAADAARLVSVFNGPVVAHLMECLEGREYLRTFGQSGKAMDHALAVLEVNARAQILNALTLTALAKYLVNYGTRALAQFASVERLLALSALRPEEAGSEKHGGESGRLRWAPREKKPPATDDRVHSLAVGATLVGFACLVGFVRFGMEAVYATIASSMLTTLAGWLVFFLTGLLIKFIEKFTTKSSTSSTERSSTAVLLLIYCAAGCLPGVLQQPMTVFIVLLTDCHTTAFPGTSMPSFPLQPLTLKVMAGEHLAMVGSSGAGKSTLLAGLSRLLPVGGGSLILDGWEAREVPLKRWRKALLCLPQQWLGDETGVGPTVGPGRNESEQTRS
eukprot:g27841.t1